MKIKIMLSRGKIFLLATLSLGILMMGAWLIAQQKQQYEIKKAIIYQDIYPIISESDLYCSFLIWDKKEKPDLKIIGAEREYERVLFNNDDIVYLNKGKAEGLQPGQLFLILEFERN